MALERFEDDLWRRRKTRTRLSRIIAAPSWLLSIVYPSIVRAYYEEGLAHDYRGSLPRLGGRDRTLNRVAFDSWSLLASYALYSDGQKCSSVDCSPAPSVGLWSDSKTDHAAIWAVIFVKWSEIDQCPTVILYTVWYVTFPCGPGSLLLGDTHEILTCNSCM